MAPEQGRRCGGELGKCITITDLTGDPAARVCHSPFLPLPGTL